MKLYGAVYRNPDDLARGIIRGEITSSQLRAELIRAGLIKPSSLNPDDAPVRTYHVGPKLALDDTARAVARRRVAAYLNGASMWDELESEGRHQWDRETGLECVKCGCYQRTAEEVCYG